MESAPVYWHCSLSLFLSPSLPLSPSPFHSPPPCNAADAGKKYPLTSHFARLTIHHTYSSHWYRGHTARTHAITRASALIQTHTQRGRDSWWRAVIRHILQPRLHILILGLFLLPFISHLIVLGSLHKQEGNHHSQWCCHRWFLYSYSNYQVFPDSYWLMTRECWA